MPPVLPINYLAVLAATVAQMVVGFLWYSPLLFGKTWMKLMNLKENEMKKGNMASSMGLMFLFTLLLTYVLAHFIGYVGAKTFMGGAVTGLWVWLGFVVTTSAASSIFEKKPWRLYFLNNGHYLVNLVVGGGILAVWP